MVDYFLILFELLQRLIKSVLYTTGPELIWDVS
jgi:hypothetical protein